MFSLTFFLFFFFVFFFMKDFFKKKVFFFYFKFMVFFSIFFVVMSSILLFNVFEGYVFFKFFLMGQKISLSLDFYSFSFNFLLVFVSSSIMSYSFWYFKDEPKNLLFYLYLLLFMFFMFMLTNITSLFFLLVSWESVSVMSFLLISWWLGRSEATQSSIQAIIYNRVGDFGFYLTLFFFFFFGLNFNMSSWGDFSWGVLFFIFFSILAKSSQFFFHPWLPNAMESPTPVSSLLHSSTMVVAGVFLSIRLSDFFNYLYFDMLMFMGSITMLFSSICAMSQLDIKKIIAFSTTSQLGFMILVVSIGNSFLSFFLLVMHAFFKSMLFMSSGVYIHFKNNDQFVDKMSFSYLTSKMVVLGFFFSSLSLMGFPFLSGFYSKDVILENMWGPMINRFIIFIFFFACCFTVSYTIRMILMGMKGLMMDNFLSKMESMEFLSLNISWVLSLFVGSVFFSLLSINFFFNINLEELIPLMLKISPLIILLLGLSLSMFLVFKSILSFMGYYMLFFNPLVHRATSSMMLYLNNLFILMEMYGLEFLLKNFFLKSLKMSFKKSFYFFNLNYLLIFFFFFSSMLIMVFYY